MQVLSSTTILVKWRRVPEKSRHGIIIHYTIHYKDVERNSSKTINVEAPALNATINGLRQKAEYSIQIQASTSKGSGPLSEPPVTAQTDGE